MLPDHDDDDDNHNGDDDNNDGDGGQHLTSHSTRNRSATSDIRLPRQLVALY